MCVFTLYFVKIQNIPPRPFDYKNFPADQIKKSFFPEGPKVPYYTLSYEVFFLIRVRGYFNQQPKYLIKITPEIQKINKK